ncbi:hypothetical protein HDU79_008755 [Rhizoclosmatium sp. JEL0117]|nr:hypothetical protein HDU79_008755 [Rhizoclosmatium sp. JEL0117]
MTNNLGQPPFPLPGDGANSGTPHFGTAAPPPPGWPGEVPWPPGLEPTTATVETDASDPSGSATPLRIPFILGLVLGLLLVFLVALVYSCTGKCRRPKRTRRSVKEYAGFWVGSDSGKVKERREIGNASDEFMLAVLNSGNRGHKDDGADWSA